MAKAATAAIRTYASSVGVPNENRQAIISLLNLRLADSVDIHSQVKWAHWNVKGKDFYQLHLLFDSVATHLEDHIDTIAERVAALGGVANGTIREAVAKSSIPEANIAAADGSEMVKFLIHNVGQFTNALRAAIKEAEDLDDAATVDLFTTITRDMDKDLWFIEAHTQA